MRLPLRMLSIGVIAVLGAAHAAPEACGTLERAVPGQGPVFVASFPTAEPGPLRDAAFTYDNAVAAIALVACGNPKQAAQIGDALLTGLDHDRYWKDGRLRNAYLAGPVTSFPVKLPGWWDMAQNKWVEDGYQVGSDTGNMAWSILALLTISDATGPAKYREGAQRIAHYLEASLSRVKPVGFDGGSFGDEPAPFRNRWKSTEHNTDLAAAFARLGNKRARTAEAFVRAMWQPKCHCFDAGTTDDGHTRNALLALDAQIWPLLALPGASSRYPGVLDTVEARLRQAGGYTFAEGSQGIWTEGTAQTALLLSLSGRQAEAQKLLGRLQELRAPDGYYFATDSTELKTGLAVQTDTSKPRAYFHSPHLAALAWVALAETGFNPFTGTRGLP
jgi:hypothetical protein